MAQRPIPAHWKKIMEQRGIASIRQLSHRAGVSQPTVNALVMGDARLPQRATLSAVAGALQIPLAKVYELAGLPSDQVGEWDPPEEANRLTPRQRRAFDELIRATVEAAEKTDNVRHLHPVDEHPERDNMGLAAHKGHGPYQDPQEGAGEEPQD